MTKKLAFLNNIGGIGGFVYTIMAIVITFMFKEKSQKIIVIAILIFIVTTMITVIAFAIAGYFKQKLMIWERSAKE